MRSSFPGDRLKNLAKHATIHHAPTVLLTLLNKLLSSAIAFYQRAIAEDSSWVRQAQGKIAILPAAIVQPSGRATRLWCLVRSLNHPENGGSGSGLVEISIAELCGWLRRSERTVWRYLQAALSKGYLHSYHCEYGQLRIEYRGLKSLCKHLGLSHLDQEAVWA